MTTLLHLPFDIEAGYPIIFNHGAAKTGFMPFTYSSLAEYYIKLEANAGKYADAVHLRAAWLTAAYQPWMDLQGDWTFEGWINTTLENTNHVLMCRWADGNGPWRFGLGSSGNLWFDYLDASGAVNPTTSTSTLFVPKNTWTHFAFVRTSGVLTGYINGAVAFTQNVASIKVYAAPNLTVGRSEQANVWHYYGYMDDFRFSDVALYTAPFTPLGAIAYTPITSVPGGVYSKAITKSYYPWPPTNMTTVACLGGISQRLADAYYGGAGTIEGHTYVLSGGSKQPVARRVRLFVQPHGGVLAETWSDAATGYYTFQRLSKDYRYFVMSYDHTGANEAVVGTNIRPV